MPTSDLLQRETPGPELSSSLVSDMASLFRLGSRALARHHSCVLRQSQPALQLQARAMGGSPYEGDPPTTTLGGLFKNPV